jgi:hypothetical protein
MIVLAALACAALGCAAPGALQTGDSGALEAHLIDLERRSWVAWQARDAAFFRQFLSDDHIEYGATGLADKSEVVATVGAPQCVVRSYAVDQFRFTRFTPDAAMLTYRAEQDTVCGGFQAPSPAWATSLYVRRGGRWLNAVYGQTPVSR